MDIEIFSDGTFAGIYTGVAALYYGADTISMKYVSCGQLHEEEIDVGGIEFSIERLSSLADVDAALAKFKQWETEDDD